jgi:hypothetical protein
VSQSQGVKIVPPSLTPPVAHTGYCTQQSFDKSMLAFQKSVENKIRPQIVFVDGWDAHFSPILRAMRADNIFVFFLRAQNSSVDQPNDNGPNAMFHGAYSTEFARLNAARPNLPTEYFAVNKSIAAGIEKLRTAAGAKCVTDAYAKTGIWPVDRNTESQQRAAELARMYTPAAQAERQLAVVEADALPPQVVSQGGTLVYRCVTSSLVSE